jgi:hypothetical protein
MRIFIIVILSLVIVAVVAIAVLFVVGGIFEQPLYSQPWSKTYAQQFTDFRIRLAAYGILAANGHNMQPWKIKLDASNPNIFYLYVDSNKLTPEVDPFARQALVSQGTFLEYVRVAGEQWGMSTTINLFPNGTYDEKNLKASMDTMPVARITIATGTPQTNDLYNGIFLPDTNRSPYKTVSLSADQIQQLQSIAIDPNVTIKTFQDPNDIAELNKFAITGTTIEAGIHRINVESAAVFRSNEYQKNEYRNGFSVEGQGTAGVMIYLTQGLITLFPSFVDESAASALQIKIAEEGAAATPAYAMIITKNNSRLSQVQAGMAYSRLILVAHSLGLVMQPPSQVLEEYPEMSEQYTKIHKEYAPEGATIQMFVRVGQSTQEYPVSMREDVMSFVQPS